MRVGTQTQCESIGEDIDQARFGDGIGMPAEEIVAPLELLKTFLIMRIYTKGENRHHVLWKSHGYHKVAKPS